MSKLAILGGDPVIRELLRPYRSMSERERQAVTAVIDSDCLSGFYGSAGEEFFGGPRVRAFEQAWCARLGCRHAVSVNSATTGLLAAVGAAGIGPGDEVIVPPYTMSATAVASLFYGGIPVFADIEPETFCLDVAAVKRVLTARTRAIIAVNLFGHPARLHELRRLADERGIVLIEDNAQAPLAQEAGRYAGTIGHVGVFSLNYHKHIHTGEGGICVTDDAGLAQRRNSRNHGENVAEDFGVTVLQSYRSQFPHDRVSPLSGLSNSRMPTNIGRRTSGETLSAGLAGLEGLAAPAVREDCRHVYTLGALRR